MPSAVKRQTRGLSRFRHQRTHEEARRSKVGGEQISEVAFWIFCPATTALSQQMIDSRGEVLV